MRLIYTATGKPVAIGDTVYIRGQAREVKYFFKPHKPDSEGKVNVVVPGSELGSEYFVSVIGAEWIEREDRKGEGHVGTEYSPGIGWQYVIWSGRYGNFETEAAALAAGRAQLDRERV